MGFELNRIMQQYGVATPGRINYSGANPVDPGARPVASDALSGEALTKAQTDYDALLNKYNFDKATQASDTAAYDAYRKEYQTRLQNTPMYMQSQFQTGYEPKSAGLQYAENNMGVKQFNKNIQDWAAQNPNAYSTQINEIADKYGVSAQDIYNATQNRWGNVLGAPKYGTYTAPTTPTTPVTGGDKVIIEDPTVVVPPVIPPVVPPVIPPVVDPVVDPVVEPPIVDPIIDPIVDPVDPVVDPVVDTDVPSIYTKPIVSDIKDDEVKPEDIPLITAPDILETIPSIYTKEIDSSIPDTVIDPNNIPTIPADLQLPEIPQVDKTDVSFWDSANTPDVVGPNRAGGGDLPEEFDKYLVPDSTDTTSSVADNVTSSTQDALDALNSQYDMSGGGNYDWYDAGGWGGGDFGGFGGGGGGGGKYEYNFDNMAYAKGGPVKTHYQTAGSVQLPSGYSDPETEADWMSRWQSQQVPVQTSPVDMSEPPAPITLEPAQPKAPLTAVALNAVKEASAPVAKPSVAAPKAPAPFGDERMGNIQALLAAYGPKDTAYGEDLKAARTTAKAESDAFAKMLSDSMKSPQDEQSSKAEMYFRLAAAFGAPTKTGHFAENLGMVGKELGEYSKEKRASAQQKLALALKAQEMKMGAAKEDLRSLQALAGEEMKDKRAIATELIKDYIKSGEPQSTAGKQALDEGLKPGTPEYQKRVEQIGNMNVEGKLAQINAALAGVTVAQANLALSQEKFSNLKQQQAKLSPTEINMKKEAEDTIAIGKQSLADLKQAYALNPNSLAGGWMDKGQQWLAEAAGSKDPTIVNTRILNNLLGSQGLAKLKSTFGGNPTEGERAIMLELEGIGSKTKEERAAIIKRTYKVLQDKQAREQARLDQINSGAYRSTMPLEGGQE